MGDWPRVGTYAGFIRYLPFENLGHIQEKFNQFLSHVALEVLGLSLLDSGLQRDENETRCTD